MSLGLPAFAHLNPAIRSTLYASCCGPRDGFVLHQSTTYTAAVYDEDSGPHLPAVRATHFDQNPLTRQGPPSDLDGLLIEITVRDDVASLRLTPAHARQLASLLITVAEAVDPLDAT